MMAGPGFPLQPPIGIEQMFFEEGGTLCGLPTSVLGLVYQFGGKGGGSCT